MKVAPRATHLAMATLRFRSTKGRCGPQSASEHAARCNSRGLVGVRALLHFAGRATNVESRRQPRGERRAHNTTPPRAHACACVCAYVRARACVHDGAAAKALWRSHHHGNHTYVCSVAAEVCGEPHVEGCIEGSHVAADPLGVGEARRRHALPACGRSNTRPRGGRRSRASPTGLVGWRHGVAWRSAARSGAAKHGALACDTPTCATFAGVCSSSQLAQWGAQ